MAAPETFESKHMQSQVRKYYPGRSDTAEGVKGMTLEQNLLLLFWTAGIAAAVFLVPKRKRHAFFLAFLISQGLGWIVQIFLVQWGLIAYPVREFPHASNLGLTKQLITFPVCCGMYVIYEPIGRHWARRIAYSAVWIAALTAFDHMLERYTDILSYTGFHWYYASLYFLVMLRSGRAVVRWFFRNREELAAEKAAAR